jgi:hypothetical protein
MDDWRKIASPTMSAVTSSFRAHFSMHSSKSTISLSLKLLLLLCQPRPELKEVFGGCNCPEGIAEHHMGGTFRAQLSSSVHRSL